MGQACPKCGATECYKSQQLETFLFTIAVYKCPKCGHKFKIVN